MKVGPLVYALESEELQQRSLDFHLQEALPLSAPLVLNSTA